MFCKNLNLYLFGFILKYAFSSEYINIGNTFKKTDIKLKMNQEEQYDAIVVGTGIIGYGKELKEEILKSGQWQIRATDGPFVTSSSCLKP